MSTATGVIHLEKLTMRYTGGGGISSVSFSVPEGSSLSVIGSSGCGKTTLAHLIAGLLEAQSGKCTIPTGHRISLVQQKDALFPWLSARKNIELGAGGHRRRGGEGRQDQFKAQANDLSRKMGISQCMDRYPAQLSGGERQRVSIARALMSGADILILDEPCAALDAFTRERLQDLLLELQQERRLTAIYITHNIEEALFLSPRIMVMGQGRVHAMVENSMFPDSGARTRQEFYARVLELRRVLDEAAPALDAAATERKEEYSILNQRSERNHEE
ncbi:ABC transporter ATP-binding protein [Salinispira pacifica]|uniref:Taurine transport ATP-binding protein TauB n=1 Tax=Salinispira pacifica TaxID=1307761 RepID=V5WKS5_9SPIO|nr:ATP-binding cassette domain-containing protein [Salinispira pacifica]AHC16353.1 Taurine transport ATP-binding protein TauB [Salinispira pacifica]